MYKFITELVHFSEYLIKKLMFTDVLCDMMKETEKRMQSNKHTENNIIWNLLEVLHEKNSYVRSFKYTLEAEPSPDLAIKIDSGNRFTMKHSRWCNAPECNEVVIIIWDEETGCHRGIILHSRVNQLKRLREVDFKPRRCLAISIVIWE